MIRNLTKTAIALSTAATLFIGASASAAVIAQQLTDSVKTVTTNTPAFEFSFTPAASASLQSLELDYSATNTDHAIIQIKFSGGGQDIYLGPEYTFDPVDTVNTGKITFEVDECFTVTGVTITEECVLVGGTNYTVSVIAQGSPPYVEYQGSGTPVAYYVVNGAALPFDDTTRVVATTPAHGDTIATSTAATIGAQVYVNDADYTDGMFVEIKYANYTQANATSVACVGCFYTTVTMPITTAGLSDVSTTSPVLAIGKYTMTTAIKAPSTSDNVLSFLGFSQFANFGTKASIDTQFTAVRPTQYDMFVASTSASIEGYIASSTFSMASCSEWVSFNLGDCLGILLIPQYQPIAEALTSFKDGFLSVWPLGYVTRILEIMFTPSVVELPNWVVTMPNFSPAAQGQTIDLTPWPNLLGADSYLSEATNPDTGHTLYEIVYPTWSNFVYLLGFILMISDILGLGTKTIGAHERVEAVTHRRRYM